MRIRQGCVLSRVFYVAQVYFGRIYTGTWFYVPHGVVLWLDVTVLDYDMVNSVRPLKGN